MFLFKEDLTKSYALSIQIIFFSKMYAIFVVHYCPGTILNHSATGTVHVMYVVTNPS